jgi:rhamnose utilization protein RhaD (predicted bifunctional aldolase and dehydrogenase)
VLGGDVGDTVPGEEVADDVPLNKSGLVLGNDVEDTVPREEAADKVPLDKSGLVVMAKTKN